MQTTCPHTTASQAPLAPRRPTYAARARHLAAALWSRLNNPRVRQVPFGHPEALVDRPGERRIVFGHNVLIIRDKPPTPDKK